MMKKAVTAWMFIGGSLIWGNVQAETYALTATDGSTVSSFVIPANWRASTGHQPSEEGFPLASDTFIIPKGKIVRTPASTASFAFPATVQFGDQDDRQLVGRFCSKGRVEFGRLLLRGGRVCDNGGFQVELAGPIEVTASDSSPFILNAHQNLVSGSAAHFLISGALSAGIGCGMDLAGRSAINDGTGTDAVFNLIGDTSAYDGVLSLRNMSDDLSEAGCKIHLNLGMTTEFPGTLAVYKGGTVGLCNGMTSASIGTLALYDGSALDVSVPGSYYTVGTLTGAAGAMTSLVLPAESDVEKTNACPARTIVRAPDGVRLDPTVFALDPFSKPNWRVQNGASANILELTHGETVTLASTDGYFNKANVCSFSKGTNWSNGEAPDSEKDYLVPAGLALRTDPSNIAVSFAGRSLMLADANLDFKGPEINVDDLRVVATSLDCTISQYGNANALNNSAYVNTKFRDYLTTFGCSDITILGGKLSLKTSSSHWLTLNVQRPRGISIASRIVGTGNLYINGGGSSANTNAAFDQNQSFAELSGDNSGWHDGRVEVHSRSTGIDGFVTRLAIHASENLGGTCSSFVYNALALFDQTELYAAESMTLADSTRGLAFTGTTRVNTPDNVTFGIHETMDFNGTVVKIGAGTLSLGGAAPTFNTKTTPTADKNLLLVNEGALKVVSSDALMGLSVTIADGVALKYDIPTDMSAGLGRYGAMLTESSLNILGETVSVQIGDAAGSAELQMRRNDWFVGLATFATREAAQAFAGKVRFAPSPYEEERIERDPVVVSNGDGTYTVGATLAKSGLLVIFK